MPTHGPQAGSSIRTPAISRSMYVPERVIWSRIWREPGVAVAETRSSDSRWPRMPAPQSARSSYEELTDEPMQTCSIAVPTSSSTGTTLPGLEGLATKGTSAARSMCSSSSKSPVSPVTISTKSSPRCCSWSQAFVASSAGKTAPVAPSSAIMFAIVPRSV